MKTIRFSLTIFFIVAVLKSPQPIYAQSEQISEFNSLIQINLDGTIDVLESIIYFFPTSSHGIYRFIPLTKENQENKKYVMELYEHYVSDGLNYTTENSKTEINFKIGDPNITVEGYQEYNLGYKLAGALTYFSDHDELYWNVTGNDWNVPIQSAAVAIKFPEGVNAADTAINCFTGVVGSLEQNCIASVTSDGFKVTAENLSLGEGLTIAVSFPNGIVSVLEPQPYPEPFGLPFILLLLVAGLFYYLVLPIYLFIKFKKQIREEEKRVVSAWFSPPKFPNGRELSAGEVGALHDRTGDVRDLSATIVQLAQKGYLKINEKVEGKIFKVSDISLIKTKDFDSVLLAHEKYLLEFLFDGKDIVRLNDLQNKTQTVTKVKKFYEMIEDSLLENGFLLEKPSKTRLKWAGVASIAGLNLNVLLLIAGIIGIRSSKRTKEGAEAVALVKSLRNFLVSQNEKLDFQAQNQMFFEKLLPYATAFGVESIWITKFKNIELAKPEWYDSNAATFSFANFTNNLGGSVGAMTTTRSSSGFSSGFSGGSSGGGGGGGGGGSW